MYLCIFTATVITVYKYDKPKKVCLSDQFKMEESKTIRHFTVITDLNVTQKYLAW